MSDLTIALALIALLVGIIIGRCVELFGATGLLQTRHELDIEVELNVKLLKEKSEWILERATFRRTLSDPIVLAEILELAKNVDKATSDALHASIVDEGEVRESDVSGHSRSSVTPCGCGYTHAGDDL